MASSSLVKAEAGNSFSVTLDSTAYAFNATKRFPATETSRMVMIILPSVAGVQYRLPIRF
jgi:hypothetical protein